MIKAEDIVKCIKTQIINWWERLNRIEDTKLVKKIAGWNAIELRTKGRPKNRQREEVINDLRKLKLRKWSQNVKGRNVWKDLVQKTKTHVGL